MNLLRARGHDVEAEYYVNDAGRQMDILAVSVFLRYLKILASALVFHQQATEVITSQTSASGYFGIQAFLQKSRLMAAKKCNSRLRRNKRRTH